MPRPETPKARLGWQLAGEFYFEPRDGPNRRAADGVVAHLRAMERTKPIDAADLMAVVMLGEAVDGDPTNAALWGQYRSALDVARGVGTSADDDAFTKLLRELGAADLPDAEVAESADARGAGRQGGGAAGQAADASPATPGGRRRRTAT